MKLRVLERYYAAVPVVLVVLAMVASCVRPRGKKQPRRVAVLDRLRLSLAVLAACVRVAMMWWDGVTYNVATAGAALVAGLVGYGEARALLAESSWLRVAWIAIAASACYDVVGHVEMLPWAALACCAGFSYALFNRGRPKSKDYSSLLEDEEEETPEEAAGPFSTFVFAWMSPLLAIGFERPLEAEDLYPLISTDDPELVKNKVKSEFDARSSGSPPDKALLYALTSAFGWYWYMGCILKLVYDTTQLAQPLLLSALLKALAHRDRADDAYKLCGLIVANAVVATAVLHQYFQRTYRTGMRLKSSTTSLVFDKALVARNLDSHKKEEEVDTSKTEATSTVTNLMSVDAQRLQDSLTYMFTVVSGIYQIAACLYLLYAQLGYSAFGGFAVMLIFMPITQKVILMSRGFQREVLVHKDARVKLETEALTGVKIVKLYGWESPLADALKHLRNLELEALWQYKLVNVLSRVVFAVVPTAVSLATFVLYTLLGNKLTVSRVYTSLALFNILRFPLMMVPRAIGAAVEAMLSIERIGNYLASDEVAKLAPLEEASRQPSVDEDKGPRVYALHADLDWPVLACESGDERASTVASERVSNASQQIALTAPHQDEDATLLRGLNFDLRPGTLTAVVGETGTGKTGLLTSLLGETEIVDGSIGVHGSIAYAAQTAWIRNATLKENVLFGAPYDVDRYTNAIRRCALTQDLVELADGDETEIGEKGLTLSGGQKQRVALARAYYADADVYLLDDVLSAVDAHVAAHIFDQLVCHLRDIGKVVVLVTHNLSTLRRCDTVLCLGANRCVYAGDSSGFADLGRRNPDKYPLAAIAAKKIDSHTSLESLAPREEDAVTAVAKAAAAATAKTTTPTPSESNSGHGRLIADESRQKGGVSPVARAAYLSATGGTFAASIVVAAQLAYQAATVLGSWWLGYWAAKPKLGTALGLEVYTALSVVGVALSCVAYYIMAFIGQRAAHSMHDTLLDGLLKAPMSFFDATPLGRLVNLFSKDIYTIDEELPVTLAMWLMVGLACLMTLVTIAYATPWFVIVCFPLAAIYFSIMKYFIPTVRELKRLDATSRSPVFSSFAEALDGATTIRAFRAEGRFTDEVTGRLRKNLTAYFLGTAANRWLAVRLEMMGTVITGAAGFLAVAMHTKPNLAGLSLTYALSVTQALNWFIRMNADLENNSVAVERVVQYSNVDPEHDGTQSAPSIDWPQTGAIQVSNLNLRYRPELPLVLKNLSFDVDPGTKLALVGRTGSGKSSFLLALLRIVPPQPGSRIVVDGIDICGMQLHDLRSRVSMIPQDPVLFTGTVRFNIDPFQTKTDEDVLEALQDAQFTGDKLTRLGESPLDAVVEEGGKNFSSGEKQLLCLARACLRHSKLLLLDEATSSIDESLDDAVQNTLRTKFKASTVICIAHRIGTVLDYDRVLVLDAGKIVEDGAPANLINDPNSRFGQLAAAHAKGAA